MIGAKLVMVNGVDQVIWRDDLVVILGHGDRTSQLHQVADKPGRDRYHALHVGSPAFLMVVGQAVLRGGREVRIQVGVAETPGGHQGEETVLRRLWNVAAGRLKGAIKQ